MSDPSTTSRSRAWVEVRLDQIRANALAVQRAVGAATALIPMVKADAYGLGMEPVVATLRSIPELGGPWAFGVATVHEGETLRVQGWEGRILVFSPLAPQEMEAAAAAGLTITASTVDAARRWAEVARQPLAFHVEVDTGMGRAGFPWDRAAEWAGAVHAAARNRVVWEGCYTHFHSADEPGLEPTDVQHERFERALGYVPAAVRERLVVHSSNSAACLRRGAFGELLARPGIFLYGGGVGGGASPRPVVSVRARLVLVRDVDPGHTVGYGATYTAQRPERWGTVAIGYGDGIPRSLAGRGQVLLRGRRIPLIGRLSMDTSTVDLSGVPDAQPGDVVTFIGSDGDEEITVDEFASRAGTISYEILTGLTPRLPRQYTGY